jgi:hypothetical protein
MFSRVLDANPGENVPQVSDNAWDSQLKDYFVIFQANSKIVPGVRRQSILHHLSLEETDR